MKPKKTDPRIEVILTALRSGNTRRAAAAYGQVSHQTFYRWLAEDVTFSDAVEKAEADAEVRSVAVVIRAAQNGTWQAAAWWLERRRSEMYALRPHLRVDLRQQAETLASTLGDVTADELVNEADRIVRGLK